MSNISLIDFKYFFFVNFTDVVASKTNLKFDSYCSKTWYLFLNNIFFVWNKNSDYFFGILDFLSLFHLP